MFKDNTIAIIGQGYVGFPLTLQAAKKGFIVVAIENDPIKVAKINNHESPLQDLQTEKADFKGITATDDYSVLKDISTIIICVPTPVDDSHTPDISILKSVTSSVAQVLQPGHLIVSESTVNPGIGDDELLPILEKTGLQDGKDFYLVHCPERINPGDELWNVSNIPRVLGSNSSDGVALGMSLYERLIDAPIKPMDSMKEAEAVKVVENSFRDINIAFVNELAMSFDKLGINVVNVINGAATKPFAFMPHYPGCGVGGHCIPVDPYYLIQYASEHGFDHKLLKNSRAINNGMPNYFADKLHSHVKSNKLKVSKVGVAGISYKANIGDYRESPSFEVIERLKEHGYTVETFDPHLKDHSSVKSMIDLLSKVDALVVATNHSEFSSLNPALLAENNILVIADGKNAFSSLDWSSEKIHYLGIGVPTVL